MLDLTIVAIGSMKTAYYREAAAEYLKRLQPFAKLKMIELPAEPFRSIDQQKIAQQQEGERLLKHLGTYSATDIVLLDEGGRLDSSARFASTLTGRGRPFIFVIGGALGLAATVKQRYAEHWSLSTMTLPHELARVVLLEQLYRAATIVTGKKYHY